MFLCQLSVNFHKKLLILVSVFFFSGRWLIMKKQNKLTGERCSGQIFLNLANPSDGSLGIVQCIKTHFIPNHISV